MKIDILTIFPALFVGPFDAGIIKRARASGQVTIQCHDIREFATDKHRSVDDVPYGGGAGMVMRPEPLVAAIESIPRTGRSLRILLSPQGDLLRQSVAEELATWDRLILVAGRYEGVDARVEEGWIDRELSIGDYVLTGGEFAAMVVVDAVVRLLPGVVGNATSIADESHTTGLLEYSQYTRPPEFRGETVPEVLCSGDHRAIAEWRRKKALERTARRRPDLIATARLTEDEKAYIGRLLHNTEKE